MSVNLEVHEPEREKRDFSRVLSLSSMSAELEGYVMNLGLQTEYLELFRVHYQQ
jgi:hypothetical protein